MKLILIFIVTFKTSYQQASTETLNETLDKLIEQADLLNHVRNNVTDIHYPKNSSRIFYVNRESKKQSEKDTKSNVPSIQINNDTKIIIADILKALGLRDSNANGEAADEHGVTLTIEKDTQLQSVNTKSAEVKESSLEQLTYKSGRPAELDSSEDSTRTFVTEAGNHIYDQNPEIIIDKITYHNDKNKYEQVTEIESANKANNINENDYPITTQELKSIMNELQKMNEAETASEKNVLTRRSDFTSYVQPVLVNQGVINQPCGNVMVPYSSLCNRMLVNKLRGYQSLHSRSGDPDTRFKLNNARNRRQHTLVRTLGIHKQNRMHFITPLTSKMMSRFVYQPVYGYN